MLRAALIATMAAQIEAISIRSVLMDAIDNNVA